MFINNVQTLSLLALLALFEKATQSPAINGAVARYDPVPSHITPPHLLKFKITAGHTEMTQPTMATPRGLLRECRLPTTRPANQETDPTRPLAAPPTPKKNQPRAARPRLPTNPTGPLDTSSCRTANHSRVQTQPLAHTSIELPNSAKLTLTPQRKRKAKLQEEHQFSSPRKCIKPTNPTNPPTHRAKIKLKSWN